MGLDEPTNYLDRDGLGALVLAIKDFCENVATERWIMKGGYLRIEGQSVEAEEADAGGNKPIQEVYDAAGNKIEVKKALNAKDAKKAIKDIEKKLKNKSTLTDDECWELEDKLLSLKESLAKV